MPSVTPDAADRLLTEYPLPEAWAKVIARMTPFLTRAAVHALLFILLIGIHQFVTGILFLIFGSIVIGLVGYVLYRSLGSSLTFLALPIIPRNPFLELMKKEGLPLDVAFASFHELIILPPKEKDNIPTAAEGENAKADDGSA